MEFLCHLCRSVYHAFFALQYQEEEYEEWVRQMNEEFEEIDKHELFVTSTLHDS